MDDVSGASFYDMRIMAKVEQASEYRITSGDIKMLSYGQVSEHLDEDVQFNTLLPDDTSQEYGAATDHTRTNSMVARDEFCVDENYQQPNESRVHKNERQQIGDADRSVSPVVTESKTCQELSESISPFGNLSIGSIHAGSQFGNLWKISPDSFRLSTGGTIVHVGTAGPKIASTPLVSDDRVAPHYAAIKDQDIKSDSGKASSVASNDAKDIKIGLEVDVMLTDGNNDEKLTQGRVPVMLGLENWSEGFKDPLTRGTVINEAATKPYTAVLSTENVERHTMNKLDFSNEDISISESREIYYGAALRFPDGDRYDNCVEQLDENNVQLNLDMNSPSIHLRNAINDEFETNPQLVHSTDTDELLLADHILQVDETEPELVRNPAEGASFECAQDKHQLVSHVVSQSHDTHRVVSGKDIESDADLKNSEENHEGHDNSSDMEDSHGMSVQYRRLLEEEEQYSSDWQKTGEQPWITEYQQLEDKNGYKISDTTIQGHLTLGALEIHKKYLQQDLNEGEPSDSRKYLNSLVVSSDSSHSKVKTIASGSDSEENLSEDVRAILRKYGRTAKNIRNVSCSETEDATQDDPRQPEMNVTSNPLIVKSNNSNSMDTKPIRSHQENSLRGYEAVGDAVSESDGSAMDDSLARKIRYLLTSLDKKLDGDEKASAIVGYQSDSLNSSLSRVSSVDYRLLQKDLDDLQFDLKSRRSNVGDVEGSTMLFIDRKEDHPALTVLQPHEEYNQKWTSVQFQQRSSNDDQSKLMVHGSHKVFTMKENYFDSSRPSVPKAAVGNGDTIDKSNSVHSGNPNPAFSGLNESVEQRDQQLIYSPTERISSSINMPIDVVEGLKSADRLRLYDDVAVRMRLPLESGADLEQRADLDMRESPTVIFSVTDRMGLSTERAGNDANPELDKFTVSSNAGQYRKSRPAGGSVDVVAERLSAESSFHQQPSSQRLTDDKKKKNCSNSDAANDWTSAYDGNTLVTQEIAARYIAEPEIVLGNQRELKIRSPERRMMSDLCPINSSTLLPYRLSGQSEIYYIDSGTEDGSVKALSETTTLESTHPGSDDAKAPHFPTYLLGSRRDAPMDLMSGLNGSTELPAVQLGTIDEQTSTDQRESSCKSGASERSRKNDESFEKAKAWISDMTTGSLKTPVSFMKTDFLCMTEKSDMSRDMVDSGKQAEEEEEHGIRGGGQKTCSSHTLPSRQIVSQFRPPLTTTVYTLHHTTPPPHPQQSQQLQEQEDQQLQQQPARYNHFDFATPSHSSSSHPHNADPPFTTIDQDRRQDDDKLPITNKLFTAERHAYDTSEFIGDRFKARFESHYGLPANLYSSQDEARGGPNLSSQSRHECDEYYQQCQPLIAAVVDGKDDYKMGRMSKRSGLIRGDQPKPSDLMRGDQVKGMSMDDMRGGRADELSRLSERAEELSRKIAERKREYVELGVRPDCKERIGRDGMKNDQRGKEIDEVRVKGVQHDIVLEQASTSKSVSRGQKVRQDDNVDHHYHLSNSQIRHHYEPGMTKEHQLGERRDVDKSETFGLVRKHAWIVQDETLDPVPEHLTVDSVTSDVTSSSSVDETGNVITRTSKRHLPDDPKLLRLQQKIARQKEKYLQVYARERKHKAHIERMERKLIETALGHRTSGLDGNMSESTLLSSLSSTSDIVQTRNITTTEDDMTLGSQSDCGDMGDVRRSRKVNVEHNKDDPEADEMMTIEPSAHRSHCIGQAGYNTSLQHVDKERDSRVKKSLSATGRTTTTILRSAGLQLISPELRQVDYSQDNRDDEVSDYIRRRPLKMKTNNELSSSLFNNRRKLINSEKDKDLMKKKKDGRLVVTKSLSGVQIVDMTSQSRQARNKPAALHVEHESKYVQTSPHLDQGYGLCCGRTKENNTRTAFNHEMGIGTKHSCTTLQQTGIILGAAKKRRTKRVPYKVRNHLTPVENISKGDKAEEGMGEEKGEEAREEGEVRRAGEGNDGEQTQQRSCCGENNKENLIHTVDNDHRVLISMKAASYPLLRRADKSWPVLQRVFESKKQEFIARSRQRLRLVAVHARQRHTAELSSLEERARLESLAHNITTTTPAASTMSHVWYPLWCPSDPQPCQKRNRGTKGTDAAQKQRKNLRGT